MKLRNKKTGEVVELKLIQMNDKYLEDHEVDLLNGEKLTLKSLADSFADVKEPLIKDEKIRKAVRAWAEANDYGSEEIYEFVDFSTGWKSWSLDHKGNGDDNEIHFNGGIDFDKVEHQGYYTIEELCGEEEE